MTQFRDLNLCLNIKSVDTFYNDFFNNWWYFLLVRNKDWKFLRCLQISNSLFSCYVLIYFLPGDFWSFLYKLCVGVYFWPIYLSQWCLSLFSIIMFSICSDRANFSLYFLFLRITLQNTTNAYIFFCMDIRIIFKLHFPVGTLTGNLWCTSGWPGTLDVAAFAFTSVGIISMCHHVWPLWRFFTYMSQFCQWLLL